MNLTVCPMCKQAVPPHKVHSECLEELLKTGNPNHIRLT
jgi:large subunit ribosomal protein L32